MSTTPLFSPEDGDSVPGRIDLTLALSTPGGSRYLWPLLTAHSPAAATYLARMDGPLVRALSRFAGDPARAMQARERIAADVLTVLVRALANQRPALAALAHQTPRHAPASSLPPLRTAVTRALTREGVLVSEVTAAAIAKDTLTAFAHALDEPTPARPRDPRRHRLPQ